MYEWRVGKWDLTIERSFKYCCIIIYLELFKNTLAGALRSLSTLLQIPLRLCWGLVRIKTKPSSQQTLTAASFPLIWGCWVIFDHTKYYRWESTPFKSPTCFQLSIKSFLSVRSNSLVYTYSANHGSTFRYFWSKTTAQQHNRGCNSDRHTHPQLKGFRDALLKIAICVNYTLQIRSFTRKHLICEAKQPPLQALELNKPITQVMCPSRCLNSHRNWNLPTS